MVEIDGVRGEGPSSLTLIDKNTFKAFKDGHGHSLGDDCLQATSDWTMSRVCGVAVCE
ncbi:diguanylate cyclase (plasmid) [Sinorhizobium sp. BG8]|nr:diguanylate cyclase [Sinorhizobium sp. BG8]